MFERLRLLRRFHKKEEQKKESPWRGWTTPVSLDRYFFIPPGGILEKINGGHRIEVHVDATTNVSKGIYWIWNEEASTWWKTETYFESMPVESRRFEDADGRPFHRPVAIGSRGEIRVSRRDIDDVGRYKVFSIHNWAMTEKDVRGLLKTLLLTPDEVPDVVHTSTAKLEQILRTKIPEEVLVARLQAVLREKDAQINKGRDFESHQIRSIAKGWESTEAA